MTNIQTTQQLSSIFKSLSKKLPNIVFIASPKITSLPDNTLFFTHTEHSTFVIAKKNR